MRTAGPAPGRAPDSKGPVGSGSGSRGGDRLKVRGRLPGLGPTHEKASRRVPGRGSRRLGRPVSFGASPISPERRGARRPRVGPSIRWTRPGRSRAVGGLWSSLRHEESPEPGRETLRPGGLPHAFRGRRSEIPKFGLCDPSLFSFSFSDSFLPLLVHSFTKSWAPSALLPAGHGSWGRRGIPSGDAVGEGHPGFQVAN